MVCEDNVFSSARSRWDGGFTVVEVVVSAAILFVALTALLGLVGASQRMTVTAKERAVLTNALAWYADHVRAMPYEKIDMTPVGLIPAEETLNFTGEQLAGGEAGLEIPVTFRNRVSFPDGADGHFLRTITIAASTVIDGRTFTSQIIVNVKNPADDTTASTMLDPDAPEIEFLDPTPAPNSVLTGSRVFLTNSLTNIRVRAASPSDAIEHLKITIGDSPLRDASGSGGADASWDYAPARTSTIEDTGWDSTQEGVQDGFQLITAIATDNRGRSSSVDRQFIIDNHVPQGEPGPVQGVAVTSTRAQLAFLAATDGYRAFASRYQCYLYKEPTTTPPAALSAWPLVTPGIAPFSRATDSNDPVELAKAISFGGTLTIDPVETAPFSRYTAKVHAGSPIGFNWDVASPVTRWFVSRPEIYEASCTVVAVYQSDALAGFPDKGTWYYVDVIVSAPAFPATGASYQLQALNGADSTSLWKSFGSPYSNTNLGSGRLRLRYKYLDDKYKMPAPKPYTFRVAASLTPSGWGGGTISGPHYTNIAGVAPAPPTPAGSERITRVGPWTLLLKW